MKKSANPAFIFDFSVRGYELDSFGHVNNAVYVSYLEQARWEILAQTGWLGWFADNGRWLVVTETNIRYARELRNFDHCCIETRVVVSDPFLVFKHQLWRKPNDEKIAHATVKTLLVDHNRVPLDVPADMLAGLKT